MEGFVSFLNFISKSPEKALIKVLTKNERIVHLVCEILLNILLKNIKVDKRIIRKLRKYKRIIYKLVDKRTSLSQRRKLLLKSWPIVRILTPLLPLIGKSLRHVKLFQNVFNKRSR